jgi:hypothetical protein
MENKVKLGQFYTKRSKYIIGNLLEDLDKNLTVVEPFCGEGDLLIFDNEYEIYDIDPKIEGCKKRDTLSNDFSYNDKRFSKSFTSKICIPKSIAFFILDELELLSTQTKWVVFLETVECSFPPLDSIILTRSGRLTPVNIKDMPSKSLETLTASTFSIIVIGRPLIKLKKSS